MFLEIITEKSLQKTENLKNNNFSQSDANVTNNSETIVRYPNELRQLLHTNLHFSESQSATHEEMQLYKTSFKLDLIKICSLRPHKLMTIFGMVGKYYQCFNV